MGIKCPFDILDIRLDWLKREIKDTTIEILQIKNYNKPPVYIGMNKIDEDLALTEWEEKELHIVFQSVCEKIDFKKSWMFELVKRREIID